MSFHSFVMLAGMRTGSNFLEANLNELDGLTCHGEAFNPAFIGYPKRDEVLGISRTARDANPFALLEQMRTQPGLHGFRYFHDHDPRILEDILSDAGCAKIILTRNPLDSYISLKIAQETGQWKLTNVKMAKSGLARFDRGEFESHLQQAQDFQVQILSHLQKTGQTGFYIGYDDLHDLEVINGLARWLGCSDQLTALNGDLKPQNPKSAADKLQNAAEMEQALARLDRFNLTRTPNFEPRRGAVVPSYVAAAKAPLLYQGIRGGPEAALLDWLAALDAGPREALQQGFTQSSLRKWQRQHKSHRSFTVLRHPLARAHACFCERILPHEGDGYLVLREQLRRHHQVPLKARDDAPGYDHRAAFEAFLTFLGRNLNGQTAQRVDPWWISQGAVLEGFSKVRVPDALIREEDLAEELALLGAQVGLRNIPPVPEQTDPYAERLAEIYDKHLEKKAREVYQRDFLTFGFGPWRVCAPE